MDCIQADLGVSSEPSSHSSISRVSGLSRSSTAGKELGPFVDALSVRGDMVDKDPGTVKAFVKAVVRALVYVNANRDEMLAFAKTEFPPATEGDLKA
jgi:ABC-type nitrate/sulfonate/bicarbonate transport system substrate-binding protein